MLLVPGICLAENVYQTRCATCHGADRLGGMGHFASRDGWLTKYDLWGLETLVEVRAGINTRNAAVSSDGKYVIAANSRPAWSTTFA